MPKVSERLHVSLNLDKNYLDLMAEFEPEINNLLNFKSDSQRFKFLLDGLLEGRYVHKDTSKRTTLDDARLEKTLMEIKVLKNRVKRELIHDFKTDPNLAHEIVENRKPIELAIGDTNESISKSMMGNRSTIHDLPYDIKNDKLVQGFLFSRFVCTECGVVFEFRKSERPSMVSKLNELKLHMQERHSRGFTPTEQSCLDKVIL